jgi:hypothetical protein
MGSGWEKDYYEIIILLIYCILTHFALGSMGTSTAFFINKKGTVKPQTAPGRNQPYFKSNFKRIFDLRHLNV